MALLDAYARAAGMTGRSAVIQHALGLLRQAELGQDYVAAWEEWAVSGEQLTWETTAGDWSTAGAPCSSRPSCT